VIARDLAEMQVNASIAESDIGRVRPGQPVSFKVDAYPGEMFAGRVSQVRLEPTVEQNVVSYITTIDVANVDQRLKPGMTANVRVEVERAADVLCIPNAALRVRLPPELLTALGHGTGGGSTEIAETAATAGKQAEVWLSEAGRLERIPVRLGVTDGSYTAIVGGALTEGAHVVTGISTEPRTPATSTSPLLPAGGRRGGVGRSATTPRPGG
jgi:HlyD family secretion protein